MVSAIARELKSYRRTILKAMRQKIFCISYGNIAYSLKHLDIQGIIDMSFENVLWLNHRDFFHPRAGGAERTILEVSTRLVRKGYNVTWLSTHSPNLPLEQEINGIRILRLGGNISSHFRNLMFERRYRDDTVVIDDLAHVVPWLSERFSSLPGTVFFRHLHRRTLDGQLSPIKASVLKRIENNYPRLYRKWPFVTESEQGIKDLQELGLPPERTVRIPPGVDTDRLLPHEKYDQPSLIYFGGLRDYKRPYEALHLLKELLPIYPDIKLRVSGSGPSLPKMKSLALSLGLRKNVEFLGRLDEKELFDVVSRSWLNLHFSRAEGWGYSILEASSCGTPTLAYDVPGVSEAILNDKNGVTVQDHRWEELFENARKMLDNYGSWGQTSRNVAKYYSWDVTASIWEKHLLSIS